MISIESCPLCGSKLFHLITSCTDHTVSHEKFNIVNCIKCDFTITSPRPEDQNLGEYYLSDNYISHSNKASTLLDKLYLLARQFTLQWKINLLRKYQSSRNEVHILDYGCGTGEFLKSCQEAGFKISGVEPSQNARAISFLKNHIKIHETLESLEDKTYNIITLWHVLEHIPNFEEIIQRLKTKLSDDGILMIAVPNHKSFDGQHYSKDWAGFDVPRHLWHFSSATMKNLLIKNNLNLMDIRGMKLDSYYVSLLSEKYRSGNMTTLMGYLKAVLNGAKSNRKARKSGEYSSLIYIIKK